MVSRSKKRYVAEVAGNPNRDRNGLIPVAQFGQYYPWPSPQSIRNRIHAAKKYGTDEAFLDCIVYKGGRVLVDEPKFVGWLEEQGDSEAAQAN